MQSQQIRVTNPDVGGGFGMKAMGYPEEFLVSFAAIQLKRPVRWMSERTEAMLSDNAGRDLKHFAELAFDIKIRLSVIGLTHFVIWAPIILGLGRIFKRDYF